MLCACATASSATVYKWVDDKGVTHYSDQPNPKAEKIEVADAQTYGSKAATVTAPAPSPAAAPAKAPPQCMIDLPAAGQVYLDTFSVSGHVTLTNIGDNFQPTLRLDGQDISGELQADGSFTLAQVERGDHTLTFEVTSAAGACQGNAVTFSVRQRSAAGANSVPMAPTAPAAPRAPGVGTAH